MRTNRTATLFILGSIVITGTVLQSVHADSWPQWGGLSRDFTAKSYKLADTWPKDGPPKLWSRPLGDGYSAIISDGDLIFTMYRPDRTSDQEVIIAMKAKTGKTVWEDRFESKLPQPVSRHGHGPNSTPLIVGDRLCAIGTNAVVRCLDKTTGKLLWTRDLPTDFASPQCGNGYSISPIAYKNTLIIPLGCSRDKGPVNVASDDGPSPPPDDDAHDGRDRSVIALSLADGELAWMGNEYVVNQSSPTLINHGGQDQLVLLMIDGVAAIDPSSGKELWRLDFDKSGLHNLTPMWDGHDLLLFASNGGPGRAIRLVRENGMTVPHEAWFNRKMATRFYMGVHSDNGVYMPGNDRFYGYDLRTGKRLWVQRGFDLASCVLADGKLFILDRNGKLTLATPSMEKLTIHAQCQVTERDSITCPTLVGRTLFIRDRKNIMAFDIGLVKTPGN
ncbi:MAG: PQQ-binding-like beta-propeller repeat protein [Planctomycetes bacterium]|nr:PQQ-binding-like beta-propeller repeat protein [Planctomycetota bacterium]